MSPRVLLVTNDFPPGFGGIQVVQRELCARLDPSRLTVFAGAHDDDAAFDSTVGYTVVRAPTPRVLPFPEVARRVESLIRDTRPDVVIFGSALPLGLLARVARRHQVPYVPLVYGADVRVPARVPGTRQALRRVLAGAAGIVALGPWVAGETRKVCAPRPVPPILTIVPGVDVERFVPGDARTARVALGLDPDRPTVVSVSRLVPRKGMHLLLAATRRVREAFPYVQVVIAGEGRERRRLERLRHSLGVANNVRLVGPVDDASLVHLHQAADVFAMLCHDRWAGAEQEGFGIVFVEAGACGRPVVAGRSGGSADAVADPDTGTLVDAEDTAAVADAITAYLADPARAAAVGARGRGRAVDTFRWSIQAGHFREWIDERFGSG